MMGAVGSFAQSADSSDERSPQERLKIESFLKNRDQLIRQLPRGEVLQTPVVKALSDQKSSHAANQYLEKGKSGQKMYLDLEENERATIYSQGGLNYLNCVAANQCNEVNGLGWPSRNDELTFLGVTQTHYMQINSAGDYDFVEFAKVKYLRDMPSGGQKWVEGYIATDRLRNRRTDPVFGGKTPRRTTDRVGKNDFCPGKAADSLKSDAQAILGKSKEIFNENVQKIADQIRDKLGKCSFDGKENITGAVPYDKMALPSLLESARKNEFPVNIEKEPLEPGKKSLATIEDFVAIDALARTLYGEMAVCHRKGLEYPLAAAAVIQNRAMAIQAQPALKRVYCKSNHHPVKNEYACVATQPIQFSTWNKSENIEQPLCPPSDPGKNFYPGRKPPAQEVAIWNDMVKIATEVILFPKAFKSRIAGDLNGVFHYTSVGAVPIRNTVPVDRILSVAGRPLVNSRCIMLHRTTTKSGH